MNIEVFSFSILTMFLGMTVTFLVLIFLCLLMMFLKKAFDEKEKPDKSALKPVSKTVSAPSTPVSAQNSSLWLMAAVAAFLADEELGAPRASAWSPSCDESTNAWINKAVFDNRRLK